MYRAVIIDDEPIVLQGLCQMLPWEELGIQVVGTAGDGKQGKLLIERLKPHLVITDIRMREMDGMELIRQISREAPDILFIIFSGYSEFQYAKEAISYGVVGYLEKPVDVSELSQTLERAKEILKARYEKQMRQREEEKRNFDRKLLCLLRNGVKNGKDSILESGFEPLVPRGLFLCEFLRVPEAERAMKGLRDVWKELMPGRIPEMVWMGENAAVLLRGKAPEELAEKFRSRLTAWGWSVRLAAVKECADLYGIWRIYRKADRLWRFMRFYGMGGLGIYEELLQNDGNISDIRTDAIARCARDGGRTEVLEAVRQTVEAMEKERPVPELFCQACLEILYACLENLPGERRARVREEILVRELPYQAVMNCKTSREAKEYVLECAEKILERREAPEEGHYKIQMITDYIQNHYREDLSLNSLAAVADMNPTYLSALFKKQKGVSYSQYLTEVRMEKAKELLDEGRKVMDVCAGVGYYNSRHFSEAFKKYTGMTPKEYRGRKQGHQKNTDAI